MTQSEFNRMLQTVQEIEVATGLTILRPSVFRDDEGRVVEASWASPQGTVFRQEKPFTPEVSYWVNETLWRDIVYRDPTR